jgi:hypothetical protein
MPRPRFTESQWREKAARARAQIEAARAAGLLPPTEDDES